MNLNYQEVMRFYKIWWSLLRYVNKKHKCVKAFSPKVLGDYADSSAAMKIREKLLNDMEIIDSFVSINPDGLSESDLNLATKWKMGIFDDFYVVKYLKDYSIFLNKDGAYGVVGLIDPIKEIVPIPLPKYVQAFLIPFENKIIYDGLLGFYNIEFGKNVRMDIQSAYKRIKETQGVILSME